MSSERGSAALLLLAVAGLVIILTIGVADVGLALAARLQAAAAADAAALAAAPVTFRSFGATGSPAAEAGRLAAANGAVLTVCRCPIDRSWRPRVVEVAVERRVALLGIGAITVRASSRAEFAPELLLEQDVRGDPDPVRPRAAGGRVASELRVSFRSRSCRSRKWPARTNREAQVCVRSCSQECFHHFIGDPW